MGTSSQQYGTCVEKTQVSSQFSLFHIDCIIFRLYHRKYEEAIDFHKQALILSPQNPSTYSALGFVYSLMTRWNEAVEYFHKVRSASVEPSFSS